MISPTTLEVVAEIRENYEGDKWVDWTLEGGIDALEVGEVLFASGQTILPEGECSVEVLVYDADDGYDTLVQLNQATAIITELKSYTRHPDYDWNISDINEVDAFLEHQKVRQQMEPSYNGWREITDLHDFKEGLGMLLYNQDWIDPDFNPEGVLEGFKSNGGWIVSVWDNDLDTYLRRDDLEPTHYMMKIPGPKS